MLTIETAEADDLARRLADMTGESVTDAVTAALRERLAREEQRHKPRDDLDAWLTDFTAHIQANYDTRPVTKAEWDAVWDEPL